MATQRASSGRRHRRLGAAVVAVSVSLALVVTPAGAHAQSQLEAQPADDGTPHLPDLDTRAQAPAIAPTAAQLDAVQELDASVRWTRFGTAQSVIRHGELLATGIQGSGPAAAARAWLDRNRSLYRLDSTEDLRVHAVVPLTGDAYAVSFRQYVGGLPVSPGGVVSVALTGSPDEGWGVAYASSTLVAQDSLAGSTDITMREAFAEAARDAGINLRVPQVRMDGIQSGWGVLDADGVESEQLVRRVAFASPRGGVRPAYEVILMDGTAEGYRHLIDASSGAVLYRASIVHQADDNPTWEVFQSTPPTTGKPAPPWRHPGADRREVLCWERQPGCTVVVGNDAARVPWDVDARTGQPTFTTAGNAVIAAEAWTIDLDQQPTSTERSYQFPWTNVWHESGCHSDNFVPGGNDIDAAVTNLFVANWRMHDWAYHLGFTEEAWNSQEFNFGIRTEGEGDPVIARAQAGAVAPGLRNNASMGTRPDGTPSVMNMFVWQPAANSFYGPCVTGDFDMSVIGHEYTHMIENRMIGKGDGRSGFHAGAMGESWSDFISMEFQNEYRIAPRGGHRAWTVGAYVTGNRDRGIRNYNMSFPSAGELPRAGRDVKVGTLNLGSMGYDITGPQVHADSQIWSATNHDIRSLMLDRYKGTGRKIQRECADGLRPAETCPGNRRWIQIVFDAMLLMPTRPTMLDARDAYFAADLLRFDGANQDLLWQAFARRGFGEHASVEDANDTDPVPSFESPLHEEATLRFEAVAKDEGGHPVDAEVFVGNYEARATPIDDVERFVPDPEGYNFVARAEGYGHVRFHVRNLKPGGDRDITIHFPTNVASTSQGATATGEGFRHADLIDDTEATNWSSAPDLPNVVVVDPPSAAAGQYGAAGADFGPAPTEAGMAGDIVLVDDGSGDPTDGCEPLVGFPAGSIALIDRGSCAFTQKARHAQDAGAVAVIVANNVPGDPFGMGGADATIVIPSVMISLDDGGTLKTGLPASGAVAQAPSEPVEGTGVTIELDGERSFTLAKASAMLREGQNRFTALRQFELYACTAGTPSNPSCDGTTGAGWDRFLRSSPDAFPAPNPRPSSPDLVLRSFQVRDTTATHVRFVVVANQCTGNPDYQGNQHSDPLAPTSDCRSATVGSDEVRAAELQLLTSRPRVDGAHLDR